MNSKWILFLEKSFMTKGQKYWERTLRLRDVLLSIIQFLPPHHKRGLAVHCQYFEYMTCPEVFFFWSSLRLMLKSLSTLRSCPSGPARCCGGRRDIRSRFLRSWFPVFPLPSSGHNFAVHNHIQMTPRKNVDHLYIYIGIYAINLPPPLLRSQFFARNFCTTPPRPSFCAPA